MNGAGKEGQHVAPEQAELKIKPVLIIGIAPDGRPIVSGQIENKKLCLNLLADVIKVIANYEPSKIVQAPTGLILPK